MKNKKSLITLVTITLFAFWGTYAAADTLEDLHKIERRIHKTGQKSQMKINNMFEQVQVLKAENRGVLDEVEELSFQNGGLEGVLKRQLKEIDSLDKQIQQFENTLSN